MLSRKTRLKFYFPARRPPLVPSLSFTHNNASPPRPSEREKNREVNFSHTPHFISPVQQAAQADSGAIAGPTPGHQCTQRPAAAGETRCRTGREPDKMTHTGDAAAAEEGERESFNRRPMEQRTECCGHQHLVRGKRASPAKFDAQSLRPVLSVGSFCRRLLCSTSIIAQERSSRSAREGKKQSVRPISDVHRFFRCHRH